MSQKVLELKFLKLRDISQLRDISPKKRKWDGLLIGIFTVVPLSVESEFFSTTWQVFSFFQKFKLI